MSAGEKTSGEYWPEQPTPESWARWDELMRFIGRANYLRETQAVPPSMSPYGRVGDAPEPVGNWRRVERE